MNEEVKKAEITEKALNLVLEAIKNVNNKYYKSGSTLKYERMFCYELYHQFRILQHDKGELNNNFILSGEPHKNIEVPIEKIYREKKKKHKANKNKTIRCSPDFIFHGGIDNYDPSNQILAIEVKANISSRNFIKDIIKLQKLTQSDKLNFQKGIFIAIEKTTSNLSQMIHSHNNYAKYKDILASSDKVYIIAIDDSKEQYCCYEVSSLL